MVYPLSALTYDDATHTYRVGAVTLPGVTSILDLVPPRSVFLAKMAALGEKGRETLAYARQLGTAVHSACHYYDEGTLDRVSLDERVVPYLEGWIRFREESEFEVIGMETCVAHITMGYAGRYDRKGRRRGHTRKVLLDIKTGLPSTACAGPQTAAYVEAELSQAGIWESYDRLSIHLPGDGTYKEFPHTDRGDFDVFKAALTIRNYALRTAA